MMRNSASRPVIEINRNLLGSGLLFLIVGGILWLAGAILVRDRAHPGG